MQTVHAALHLQALLMQSIQLQALMHSAQALLQVYVQMLKM